MSSEEVKERNVRVADSYPAPMISGTDGAEIEALEKEIAADLGRRNVTPGQGGGPMLISADSDDQASVLRHLGAVNHMYRLDTVGPNGEDLSKARFGVGIDQITLMHNDVFKGKDSEERDAERNKLFDNIAKVANALPGAVQVPISPFKTSTAWNLGGDYTGYTLALILIPADEDKSGMPVIKLQLMNKALQMDKNVLYMHTPPHQWNKVRMNFNPKWQNQIEEISRVILLAIDLINSFSGDNAYSHFSLADLAFDSIGFNDAKYYRMVMKGVGLNEIFSDQSWRIATMYYGSRQSTRYLKVYDKTREVRDTIQGQINSAHNKTKKAIENMAQHTGGAKLIKSILDIEPKTRKKLMNGNPFIPADEQDRRIMENAIRKGDMGIMISANGLEPFRDGNAEFAKMLKEESSLKNANTNDQQIVLNEILLEIIEDQLILLDYLLSDRFERLNHIYKPKIRIDENVYDETREAEIAMVENLRNGLREEFDTRTTELNIRKLYRQIPNDWWRFEFTLRGDRIDAQFSESRQWLDHLVINNFKSINDKPIMRMMNSLFTGNETFDDLSEHEKQLARNLNQEGGAVLVGKKSWRSEKLKWVAENEWDAFQSGTLSAEDDETEHEAWADYVEFKRVHMNERTDYLGEIFNSVLDESLQSLNDDLNRFSEQFENTMQALSAETE